MKILAYFSFLLILSSCSFESSAQSPQVWQLPKFLNEVSALAQGEEGRIFTLNDEKAVVYEFDPVTGEVSPKLKIIKESGKIVKGDFEGLAFLNKDIYLVTSKGKLFRGSADDLAESKAIHKEVFDTGLSEICEVEGLSGYNDVLYLVCKTTLQKQDKGMLLIYQYHPKSGHTQRFLRLSHSVLGRKKFNPSAISVSDKGIFILASRQRTLIRLDLEGNFVREQKLDKEQHRQAEGLLLTSSGQLIIADEGKKKGGFISIYQAD